MNNSRILLLPFIVFISLLFFSCEQAKKSDIEQPLVLKNGLLYKDSTATIPFTGRHKSKVIDKVIEYEVKDGIKNGDFILYYPNGKVEMKGKILNDKNEGEWKYYLPDGTLQTVGIFVNDVPESTWTWYYQDGKIFEQGNFKNGIRIGEWKTFDQYGKLRVSRKFEKGEVKDSTVFN
ncbi:MAG: toxin-antitoxin system YwqK family antitoxin [Ignavibacterium sp.]|jgi:antitoxin component YwqK of YwqJK toxin-antitoxin module|uniref:toxin-antitoxin system YwqK family antitoxin n=1 Tax=Ignavibacterium sp. TaxID=2651167 RepID=UPI003298451B